MLCYAILYYIILYYIILHYIILYYIILYYIITYRPPGADDREFIYIYFFLRGGVGVFENKTHTEQAKHEQNKKNHEIFLNILKIS